MGQTCWQSRKLGGDFDQEFALTLLMQVAQSKSCASMKASQESSRKASGKYDVNFLFRVGCKHSMPIMFMNGITAGVCAQSEAA